MDRLWYIFIQQNTLSNENTNESHKPNTGQRQHTLKEYIQQQSISKTLINTLNYHGRSQDSA